MLSGSRSDTGSARSWRGLALGSLIAACATCGGRTIDDGAYDTSAGSGAQPDNATCSFNGITVVSGTVISNPCPCVCKGGQFECQTGCDNSTPSGGAGGAYSVAGAPSVAGSATAGSATAGSATASGGEPMGVAGSGALSCTFLPRAKGRSPLIDDMKDHDRFILNFEDRVGTWFTYGDGTPGATLRPATGANDFFMSPEMDPMTTVLYGAEFSGSAFTTWGAGMGLVFNASCPYDASVYSGVTFDARAAQYQILYVLFPTVDTNGPSDGGTCSESPDHRCYDAYQKQLLLNGQWQSYSIDFASLTQQGWGAPVSFDAQRLIGINFQVPATADSFTVAIDDISFY